MQLFGLGVQLLLDFCQLCLGIQLIFIAPGNDLRLNIGDSSFETENFGLTDVSLIAALAPSRLLLVLNNAEHLQAEVGDLINRLLMEAPYVTVCVTSQIPLRLDEESVFRLSPLPVAHIGCSLEDAVASEDGTILASSEWAAADPSTPRPRLRQGAPGPSQANYFYGVDHPGRQASFYISRWIGQKPGSLPTDGGTPQRFLILRTTLKPLQQIWGSTPGRAVVIEDEHGIILQSSIPELKFHYVRPITTAKYLELASSYRYGGEALRALDQDLRFKDLRFDEGQPIDGLGPLVLRVRIQSLDPAAHPLGMWIGFGVCALCLAILICSIRVAMSDPALREAEDSDLSDSRFSLVQLNEQLEEKLLAVGEAERLLRSKQSELVQAGKLTLLGQMAAGIIHELNQPLTAILTFGSNALTFLSRGNMEVAKGNIQNINAAADHIGRILGQLKGFNSKNDRLLEVVDLQQAAQSAALFLKTGGHGRAAQLVIEPSEPLQVLCEPVRLGQVLINLIRNALEAVRDAPVKTVRVRMEKQGGNAVLSVSDTGNGIPAEIKDRLFEPFFSTKASGKGLGLGLAISSSIVEAMNGRLEARNGVLGGAEFIVTLPLYESRNSSFREAA